MNPPGQTSQTGDNEFVQIIYAIEALAKLGYSIIECCKADPSKSKETMVSFRQLTSALEFSGLHLTNLLKAYVEKTRSYPEAQGSKFLSQGESALASLKDAIPAALTIINAISPGNDSSEAQRTWPIFKDKMGNFRQKILEMRELSNKIYVIGISIFGSTIVLPRTLCKLGGMAQNKWQWRNIDIDFTNGNCNYWGTGKGDKKNNLSLIGAQVNDIPDSETKAINKLKAAKVELRPAGAPPINNPKFFKVTVAGGRDFFFMVDSSEVVGWVKAFKKGIAGCEIPDQKSVESSTKNWRGSTYMPLTLQTPSYESTDKLNRNSLFITGSSINQSDRKNNAMTMQIPSTVTASLNEDTKNQNSARAPAQQEYSFAKNESFKPVESQTKQVETKPEPKPVESKPISNPPEPKPVESKPPEPKPVETKPVSKPAESKLPEPKPSQGIDLDQPFDFAQLEELDNFVDLTFGNSITGAEEFGSKTLYDELKEMEGMQAITKIV